MIYKTDYWPLPVLPESGKAPGSKTRASSNVSRPVTFQESLDTEIRRQHGVKLSAHAEKRLRQHQITLSPGDLEKIGRALQMAELKGSKDSLIICGDIAFIANVPNKTVVTALGGRQMTEQVFTNIDSAVIIK